ncbi:MAG: hypothetical protein J7559_21090 [Cohnella sp.]|nr:hypothetical protein [Cohnella sp.]
MSYKSIDIQTSLPRTVELTPLAQHQQQRPIIEQAALAQQSMKTAEHESKRSQKTESSAKGTIKDRGSREQGKHAGTGKKPHDEDQHSESSGVPPSKHPFKGKHIDFIG